MSKISLVDILKEWKSDSEIDPSQIDIEAIKIPKLHSKYLTYLSISRNNYKKLREKKKEKEQILDDYYSGKIDGRDINREAWQLSETKAGIEKRIESDSEIIQLNLEISKYQELTETLTEIIKHINQRNFQLKVAVDFLRFTNGG